MIKQSYILDFTLLGFGFKYEMAITDGDGIIKRSLYLFGKQVITIAAP